MTGYIYIHTNKINGKKYIGQTIQKVYSRFCGGSGYKNCPKFYNAIKKYGWDNFEHEVIPAFIEELDFLEKEFIKKYDTVRNGYNTEDGGNKNKHLSEETKKKLSIKHKGLISGEKNYFYGSHRIGKLNPVSKKIQCIETGKIYNCITDLEREFGYNHSFISRVCKSKKSAYGYHWRYVE